MHRLVGVNGPPLFQLQLALKSRVRFAEVVDGGPQHGQLLIGLRGARHHGHHVHHLLGMVA
jgi:hypothetical protein